LIKSSGWISPQQFEVALACGEEADKEDVPCSGKRNFELLSEIQPEDLIKFGLIPEFVGRLPSSACWKIWMNLL